MSNNLGKMHDAFMRHNNALGEPRSGGIKTMLNEKSMVPAPSQVAGKPQTPLQHQSVVKAAKASAANRSQIGSAIPEGVAKPKAKPGFAPNPFGEKKDF